ncbi:S49 family peptidase [Salinivibrio socompensis]|uniref:S49 family peptidase n=1 Tax=Salinivibrio socompensis TaxID=1510206 RepID=UPI0004AF8098|nr:S49 family peptidase [Salinivibrio socompensis]
MTVSLMEKYLYNEPVMMSEAKFDTLINLSLQRRGFDVDMANAVYKGESQPLGGGGGVAVISVTGTLTHRPTGLNAMSGLRSYSAIDEDLDAALANNAVNTIVLDINSHGGQVAGAFDQAERIFKARKEKQIIAIVNEAAYSAAFLMASAAEKIIVPRTGGVGSIGVIAHHIDRSEANAAEGIRVTPIFAGDQKADLSPHQPLSEQAHARLQESVDESYQLFVDTVGRYRGMKTQAVIDTQAGTFNGQRAIEAKLADEVNDAKSALSQLVGVNSPKTKRIGRRAKAIQLRK